MSEALQQAIGHHFSDPVLLATALTHASWANEHGGDDNERLEFLGDAVLQAASTTLLMDHFPTLREGALSRLRARLVNTRTLAEVGRELDLGSALNLGKGEEATGGRSRRKVLACATEAVFGAVFADAGFEAARQVVRRCLAARIEALRDEEGASVAWKDPRSLLQERAQSELGSTPTYDVIDQQGPAHEPQYAVEVRVGERLLGRGRGPSKREASRQAATDALSREAL